MKKSEVLNIEKIPLSYRPEEQKKKFPVMKNLYLELIENKSKVNPVLSNSEYIPKEYGEMASIPSRHRGRQEMTAEILKENISEDILYDDYDDKYEDSDRVSDRESNRGGGRESNRGDMESDRGGRESDRGGRESDRGGRESDRGGRESDRGGRESDIESDRGDRESDKGDIESDRGGRENKGYRGGERDYITIDEDVDYLNDDVDYSILNEDTDDAGDVEDLEEDDVEEKNIDSEIRHILSKPVNQVGITGSFKERRDERRGERRGERRDERRGERRDERRGERRDERREERKDERRGDAPLLSELNDYKDSRKVYRDVNYVSQGEEDEHKKKRDILFRFDILRKSYKDSNLPDFSMHSDYTMMKNTYESVIRRLSLDGKVETYRTYLVGGFMGVEYLLGRFLKFDMEGFTKHQVTSMNSYERLLIELGEKSYLKGGKESSVEFRLICLIIVQTVIFLVGKMILKNTGSNVMGLLNGLVGSGGDGGGDGGLGGLMSGLSSMMGGMNNSSTSKSAETPGIQKPKRKMKGPDMNI